VSFDPCHIVFAFTEILCLVGSVSDHDLMFCDGVWAYLGEIRYQISKFGIPTGLYIRKGLY
jgi:hypothetical protein